MTGAIEHLPFDDPEALLRWVGCADADMARLAACAPRLSALFRLPAAGGRDAVVIGAVAPQPVGPPLSATGAGWGAREALAACLGEATEIFAQKLRPGDIVATAPLRAPPPRHGLSDRERAEASQRGVDPDAPIGWVRAMRLPDGAACLLPAPLALRGAGGGQGAPLSIGCAAGPTLAAAIGAGALELFERHAVATWRAGGPCWTARGPSGQGDGAPSPWLARVDDGFGPPVVVARSALGEGSGAGETVAAARRSALRELLAAETGASLQAARGLSRRPPAPPRSRGGAPPPGRLCAALEKLATDGAPVRVVALDRPDLAPVAKLVCFGLRQR